MPKRVAIYVRVSTDGQTVQNQLGELRQVAERHGWEIVQTYADEGTPSGRAMFQMLGVFSEFEAAMIRDRVRTGVARAKLKGTKSGKAIGRPRISATIEAAAAELLKKGVAACARSSRGSINSERYLKIPCYRTGSKVSNRSLHRRV